MPVARLVLLAALSVVLPLAARAQVTVPQPFLNTVLPQALRAGTSAEITITGSDLDGASSLVFSTPGITCAPKLDDKKQPVANRFVVTVPAGAPAEIGEVRAAARYGVSNPRGFLVTALPVVQVPATATAPSQAFKATLDTVLCGTAVKQAALFVAFEARKGQRVVAVCQPLLLDSRLDPVVALRAPDGRKLARLGPDGLLDFAAPADGAYLLEIGDLMYRGDAEFPFALTLTTGPVVEYAFDGGAQWVLYGRNLPQGRKVATRFQSDLQRLELPAAEAKRLLAANPVRAARFGAEGDAPDKLAAELALKMPARHAGWFAPRGQARAFTFEAKKGDVLWIEVASAGRGTRADAFFTVSKGDTFLAEANDTAAFASGGEFDAGAADPVLRFEAKEDGTYRVKLRNLAASSPQEPFELSIRPAASPDYDLVAIPVSLPPKKGTTNVDLVSAPVWRGGVAVLKVFALRRAGFNGPIDLVADDLPPGLSFLGGRIAEGQGKGYAAFFAAEDAPPWAGPVRLHGKDGVAARSATLQFKVANTAKESVLTRLTADLALGVVPSEAPVTIGAPEAVYEVAANGKLSVPLEVKRRGDCTEAVNLNALGLALSADIAAKADKGSLEVDAGKLKLPEGEHLVILQGTVKFKHKRGDDPKAAAKELTFLANSKPFTLRVKPAEKKP